LAQKIAAVTDCGPSPVAFLNKLCATAEMAEVEFGSIVLA
jgi:hypothetical protein